MPPIIQEPTLREADRKHLFHVFRLQAQSLKNLGSSEPFAFAVRDENGVLLAILSGSCGYGEAHIDWLWVQENFRSQGYGKALLERAESYAREKACRFMTVTTMDWQAKDYYVRHHYNVEFERHGYDKQSIKYFLIKHF